MAPRSRLMEAVPTVGWAAFVLVVIVLAGCSLILLAGMVFGNRSQARLRAARPLPLARRVGPVSQPAASGCLPAGVTLLGLMLLSAVFVGAAALVTREERFAVLASLGVGMV